MFLVDGCVVFYGSPTDSLAYCKGLGYACPDGYNAADHWMDLLVEDSAVVSVVNGNSSTTPNASSNGSTDGDDNVNVDGDDNDDEKEALVSSPFPIKLEDDVENHLNTAVNTTMNTTTTTTDDNVVPPASKKKKNRSSLMMRLSSTFTQSTARGKKGTHLLELTKRIREGYRKRIETPKGRLIIEWDADRHAEQMAMMEVEEGITGIVGSSSHGSLNSMDVGDDANDNNVKEKKFNTSWSTQFYILLHRSLKNSSAAM